MSACVLGYFHELRQAVNFEVGSTVEYVPNAAGPSWAAPGGAMARNGPGRQPGHVHPHLLRYTFASHCYMQRVPPQVVQKWLGHASVTTTERYAHLRPDTDDELIDVLERGCANPAESGATRGATRRLEIVKTPSTGR